MLPPFIQKTIQQRNTWWLQNSVILQKVNINVNSLVKQWTKIISDVIPHYTMVLFFYVANQLSDFPRKREPKTNQMQVIPHKHCELRPVRVVHCIEVCKIVTLAWVYSCGSYLVITWWLLNTVTNKN